MKHGVILFLLLALFSCNKAELERLQKSNTELAGKLQAQSEQLSVAAEKAARFDFLKQQLTGVTASIETTAGTIDIRFFAEKAPLTAYSFVTRAEAGFFNGLKFHRVMKNFMIQGGDPNSRDNNPSDDGQGGPLVAQPHEFNDVKHVRGVLSTARPPSKASGAGSQFFIMHGEALYLDNEYTAFGEVTKGMDVVDKIANKPNRPNTPRQQNYPVKPVVIKRIIVRR